MRIPLLKLLVLAFPSVLCAQQAGRVSVPEVRPAVLGGSVNEYTSTPPDITLVPRGEGARRGRLWIRNTWSGLLIVGDIEGGSPDFPKEKSSLFAKDHLEVWLAADVDPVLPPVGWGNQFGENLLSAGADSCSVGTDGPGSYEPGSPDSIQQCRDWAASQQKYRRYFQRLFIRQWLLAPGYAAESLATPAYEEIVSRFANAKERKEIPEPLKPRGSPQFFYSPSAKGYTFQVLIPWGTFPPLPSLELRDVRLLVDVFRAAPLGKKMGAFSTSSTARVWAKPETFNILHFDPAHVFHMTPCDLPLKGTDIYGKLRDAWFVPHEEQEGDYETDGFLIVNNAAGYLNEPAGLSPIARPVHDFWIGIGPGEWVCGPPLTHRRDTRSSAFKQGTGKEGLEVHRLPNGELLVRDGPSVSYSEFGSGECGTCPWTNLTIYRLTSENKFEKVLSLGDRIGSRAGPQDQDFSISPDWSEITEYDLQSDDETGNADSWSSTTYCLKDLHYEECSKKNDVNPPNPPMIKLN